MVIEWKEYLGTVSPLLKLNIFTCEKILPYTVTTSINL